MQILYPVSDIAKYVRLASSSWQFPDYSEDCLLCHGKDCAVRIGFYCRKYIIFLSQIYCDVLIARYLCREKGEVTSSHSTFSLLPSPLIPYRQFTLELVVEAIRLFCHEKLSYSKISDAITKRLPDIYLDDCLIRGFLRIFKQTFFKLTTNPQLKSIFTQHKDSSQTCPLAVVLDFISGYQSVLPSHSHSLALTTPEKCALDFFFLYQNDTYFNRQFLFGTPSQKRPFLSG